MCYQHLQLPWILITSVNGTTTKTAVIAIPQYRIWLHRVKCELFKNDYKKITQQNKGVLS